MRNTQLPAFCRTRSPRSQLVRVSSLRTTNRLQLLVLLFQLSTLLLVLGGPMPLGPGPLSQSGSSVIESIGRL
jgi:hypothetical protein